MPDGQFKKKRLFLQTSNVILTQAFFRAGLFSLQFLVWILRALYYFAQLLIKTVVCPGGKS